MKLLEILNFGYEIELMKFILPKILIATICGLIIGWERELKNKVAGLRTIVLICVGSCIFTIASFLVSKYYGGGDPTRIISNIVTGIGFLGGGVIMKHDDKIIGVTTAAFIWVISGIGILCGMGTILMPIILTIGLLFISSYFERVERFIKKSDNNK
jgi:putative Mg2+ transporter-C (MgtC) family protein